MILRQTEQLMEPEDLELDHLWLQLIQMEKAIEEKKTNYGEPEPRIDGIRTRIKRHSGKTTKASPNEMIIWMTETWNT